jgi:hypothetical protein
MKHKYIFPTSIFFLAVLIYSCNKEEAIEPSADFTTSLTDNINYVKEPFTIYLNNVVGDFITLYRGEAPNNTYGNDSIIVKGITVDKAQDSIRVDYSNAGEFELTILAVSLGNWASDYLTDVKTIRITVLDRRSDLKKFSIDKVNGKLSEDGPEISLPKSQPLRPILPMPWYLSDPNCRNPDNRWLTFLPFLPGMRKEDRLNIRLWHPTGTSGFILSNISCAIRKQRNS